MSLPASQRRGAAAHAARSPATEAINPYLFVVGCPRSGTTLLQRMLDNHPDLAVANDTHFIPRALEKAARTRIVRTREELPLSPRLLEAACSYHRFPRLELPAEAVGRAAQADTYAQFVSQLYDEYGRARYKPLAGEKTPDYVRHIPLLHALFPASRFVHVIRDGRDVALSLLEWAHETKGPGRLELWRTQPLAVGALWWRWLVRSGIQSARDLPDRLYLEVQYETLTSRPDDTLRGLAAFLDLPDAGEMLKYYEGKTRSDPGLSAKDAWLPPTAGLRNWKTEMPSHDVELFESLAGDLLSELGYERAVNVPSPHVARLASECRDWWETHGPGRSLP